MPDQAPDKRPHLVLHDPAKPIAFTAHNPKGGASKIVPDLPRQQHGKSLQDQLGSLNDLATAPAVLEKLGMTNDVDARDLLASGKKKHLLRAAEKTHNKLTDIKRFWK